MAQRPIWRGQLRLALVSCPIALYSANHDRGSLHFNLINPDTGNRVRMITQDSETGKELSRRDLVKGSPFGRLRLSKAAWRVYPAVNVFREVATLSPIAAAL